MHAAPIIRFESLALLAGLAAASAFLLAWQIEGGARIPAAKVELVTASTGELDLSPTGVTSERAALRASESAALQRELSVRNATASPREVRFAATPAHDELDAALDVRVTVDGKRLFSGTLGRFRSGTAPVRLEPGQTAAVAVRLSIPKDAAAESWRARTVSLRLDLTSVQVP